MVTSEERKEQVQQAVKQAIQQPKKRTKVAIVGFAAHRDQAPFNDPSYEIWGLNELYMYIPRYDRWFELHDLNNPVAGQRNPGKHREWLRNANIPIYMQEKYEDIPNAVTYPKDAIIEKFGRYFTNSISWMIALAISEGFETIDLYGVDMAQDEEHMKQRPSVEYFVGLARGMGINVRIPIESDLTNTAKLYAFDKDTGIRVKLKARIKELEQRINQYQAQVNQLNTAINNLNGAKQDCEYWLNVWA